MYDNPNIKQLRLVTGDEVLCDIIEEDSTDLIVRNALSINFNLTDEGHRAWSFRYFMCYQDDPEKFTLIKVDKIVAVAKPSDELLHQYNGAISYMLDEHSVGANDDGFLEEYEQLTKSNDSDESNIIKFPTVH